jgi:hypothetical protein
MRFVNYKYRKAATSWLGVYSGASVPGFAALTRGYLSRPLRGRDYPGLPPIIGSPLRGEGLGRDAEAKIQMFAKFTRTYVSSPLRGWDRLSPYDSSSPANSIPPAELYNIEETTTNAM